MLQLSWSYKNNQWHTKEGSVVSGTKFSIIPASQRRWRGIWLQNVNEIDADYKIILKIKQKDWGPARHFKNQFHFQIAKNLKTVRRRLKKIPYAVWMHFHGVNTKEQLVGLCSRKASGNRVWCNMHCRALVKTSYSKL